MEKMIVTSEIEEVLRKANFPEEKIAELKEKDFGIRQLSLDDLDNVSGGIYGITENPYGSVPDTWRCPKFAYMTWPEFAGFLDGLYRGAGGGVYGRDYVRNFCNEVYFHSRDWNKFDPPRLTAEYCAAYMFSLAYDGT